MGSYSELTKLEAMFYHQREDRHIAFLENNYLYAWFRTLNTFVGGKKIENNQTVTKKDR